MSCSVYVVREYVNSEEIREYLEKKGFETSIRSKITGDYVDEENSSMLHSFADSYLIYFVYEGDKFPSQRVFQRIKDEPGILNFDISFCTEEPTNYD